MKIFIFLSFSISILSKMYSDCAAKSYKEDCETCCSVKANDL